MSGCEDCPYDYKNTVDPSIPRELLLADHDSNEELLSEELTALIGE